MAETADTANNRPTAAVCQSAAVGAPCVQTWVLTLKNMEGCTLTARDWLVPFRVICSAAFTGCAPRPSPASASRRSRGRACNVPDPFNDTVSFDTDSDNYCPQLLDELSTSAQLTPYQDSSMTLPQVGARACVPCQARVAHARNSPTWPRAQTQFVFGTTAYFEAVVTSAVVLQTVHVVVRALGRSRCAVGATLR